MHAVVPITLAILALLPVLFVSYWQTVEAYPKSGGAYAVAKENLGVNASLLAATALMIDYVLNVAVGISARVAALGSALPALHAYMLPICLAILALTLAMELSPDVRAVHLATPEGADVEARERRLRDRWAQVVKKPARAACAVCVRPPLPRGARCRI